MENVYLVIVGVLFILAISDLIIGVSNDAVNFLNSAIGSKAFSFKIIMLVAAIGVVVGATFSSGMMEVARKGIFHPQMFYFSEIMIIFFAVMITDVILLDTFNSLGLPTSTTVSIVFELLGAAVAISLIKVMNDSGLSVSDYINSSKALAIISGILLSVVVAFLSGAIIQYITRLIFSFRFKKKMKLYGAIWGGISITAITYFILIKGLKGSSYAFYEIDGVIMKEWVKIHALEIIGVSLIAWTIILQLSTLVLKLNIPRFIVLIGTFALAMAFAGNDLVNFIGVPLAGYESYLQFIANPGADPNAFLMTGLTGKVETPFVFLLFAGLIMVVTLYFNKKARRVVKTSLDLSRQGEGSERFGATGFSKTLVRSVIRINDRVSSILPQRTKEFIKRQFDDTVTDVQEYTEEEKPAFDMIRASVNLVVASILISFGTSLKLPLSTTYVTFMVVMGTSLADNAWGRDSAVFRISGVVSIILGWFFTAFAAFTIAFIVAWLSMKGGIFVVIAFIFVSAYVVIHSHLKAKNEDAEKEDEKDSYEGHECLNIIDIHKECNLRASDTFHLISDLYSTTVEALILEDRKALKQANKKAQTFNAKVKLVKDNIKNVIGRIDDDSFSSAQHYTLLLDYMREIGRTVTYITEPAFVHVDNNHKPMGEFQTSHLKEISRLIELFTSIAVEIITEKSYGKIDELLAIEEEMLNKMDDYVRTQIKRLKKNKSGTKNTKLFLDMLSQTKMLSYNMVSLIKSQRDLSALADRYIR